MTSSVHSTVPPLPRVDAAIAEGVHAVAFHSVLDELAGKTCIVRGCEDTEAMLGPRDVFTLEVRAIGPGFDALSTLQVLDPLSIVGTTIEVDKLAVAVRLVIGPLTIVEISVGVSKPSVATRSVLPELPFELAAVRPNHDAVAMSLITKPLASVRCAPLQLNLSQLLDALHLEPHITFELLRKLEPQALL
eukprot:CAMPEP_0195026854 /NCGR_PEP_ID=MMETSP0326_2-20130528/51152_1 /TAXON_ID=2866 ORGANISM="Crypthecodinium cohnii, Strain Seligo" /NCGR_SAMPLE_ID=MMETSP0326_2 /ASSEMBLY_ACC=CAM_ASM_000348 /LENGTH=189 /DNA_ID=CAMNT_0040048863 /DNA_START=400 /DNA_END=966 /DNA_ORIENTATION=+